MKKKSQVSKLKEDIRDLEIRLNRSEQLKDEYYKKIEEYKDKEDKRFFERKLLEEFEASKSRDYMEIIRWMVNSETAKDPFNENYIRNNQLN